jgi:hypothetical protein
MDVDPHTGHCIFFWEGTMTNWYRITIIRVVTDTAIIARIQSRVVSS